MKKIVISLFAVVLCLFISGCGDSAYISSIDTTPISSATNTAVPFFTLSPSPTFGTPEVPALVKISLEFYRNGKTYEIIVGYAVGDAFFYATPHPEMPEKWNNAAANSAELKRYGDFDNDGEIEFIVSLLYCGAYCSEEIRIYRYDPTDDKYYVADSIEAKYPAVNRYDDINNDGNPELFTENYGFCYQCSPYSTVFSALTIMRYAQGKFTDVTEDFPDLIQQDANEFLESSKTNANNQDAGYIALASYLYDMYRLGKMEEARPVVDQICLAVIKPGMRNTDFDCSKYRAEVETAINEFKARP